MKFLPSDVPDDVRHACLNWHQGRVSAMFIIGRQINNLIDLDQLLEEVEVCRQNGDRAKTFAYELNAIEAWAKETLGKAHAVATVELAIRGARRAGVQQWRIQAILSQIYGDSF